VSTSTRSRHLKPATHEPLRDSPGYGVTTSSTPEGTPIGCALIAEVESYIRSYVTLAETSYALVIALWLVATHVWTAFDAFPYLVVTSSTKRSGKTRLLELMSFVASNSRLVANISPAALYRTISFDKPTLLIDEAEMFSSAKSEFRPLLNSGYRRGQTVKRHDRDYETYCPKAFALIGDVHDTLRDRSIVIEMMRSEPARRFVYATAKEEGAALREQLNVVLSSKAVEIAQALRDFKGLSFLTDRDEEIWTPLFVLCRLICPDRIDELTRAAADLSAAKTAKAKRYSELGDEEDKAEQEEYGVLLLRDMLHVIGDQKQITTQEAIMKLRQIPTSPWRRFRGEGLKNDTRGSMILSGLLSRFGVRPSTIRIAPKNQGTGSTAKGYRRRALLQALNGIEYASGAPDVEPASARINGENAPAPGKLIEYAESSVKPSIHPDHKRQQSKQQAAKASRSKKSKAWQAALDKFQRPETAAAKARKKLMTELGWAEPDGEQVVHRLFRDYGAAVARHHRRRGFPYVHKELTIAHKAEELHRLIEYDCSKLIRDGKVGWAKSGLKLANSYFPHMWSVRCRKSRTSVELFENDVLFPESIVSRMKWGEFTTEGKNAYRLSLNEIRKALRTFRGTQAVSNFRPTAAAAIYDLFLPAEGGVVFDPSAGWGGRLLGAIACKKVRKYVACDPATKTFQGLLKMKIELLPMARRMGRKLEVELHPLCSETKEMRDALPEGGVDLCFTSPPYFGRRGIVENYSDELTQSHRRFTDRESWLEGFIGQTIRNCYVALKPGGILALNVSDELVEDVTDQAVKNGFVYVDTIQLRLSGMIGGTKYKNCGECQRLTGEASGTGPVVPTFDGKWKKCPQHKYKTEPILVFRKEQ
jgi:hypothetical protein